MSANKNSLQHASVPTARRRIFGGFGGGKGEVDTRNSGLTYRDLTRHAPEGVRRMFFYQKSAHGRFRVDLFKVFIVFWIMSKIRYFFVDVAPMRPKIDKRRAMRHPRAAKRTSALRQVVRSVADRPWGASRGVIG